MQTVKELCDEYGLSMAQLAKRFGIPYRTVQDWFGGKRTPPDYVVKMMAEILLHSTEGKE